MSKGKQRDCPAAKRAITAQECGENRGTKWACPAECRYFPFTPANYDSWLELEDMLISAVLDRALGEMPEKDAAAFARQLSQSEDALHSQSLCSHRFFHERDAAGRTMVDRWEAAGWPGLRNDLRHLLAHYRTMRPALLEVRGVLDDRRIEVVDLLGDPGRTFTLIDRSMSAGVGRFSTFLSWFFTTPHGARVSGGGIAIHEQGDLPPAGVVAEILRHLGAPDEPAARAAWLAEHLSRVADAYTAVLAARWEDTVGQIDARYTKTEYRVRGRSLEQRLVAFSAAAPESLDENEQGEGFTEAWVWFEDDASAAAADQLELPLTSSTPRMGAGRPVLGRVLLGPDRAQIEASSSARHAQLRARFEKLARTDAVFVSERTDDLGRQILAGKKRPHDAALVPPRLLEQPCRLHFAANRIEADEFTLVPGESLQAAAVRRQYATFADEPIPALGGATPRAAASDPALRPRLLQLMRGHVRTTDELGLRDGFVFDLNPLLSELGLDEIILPPPPLRTPLPREDDEDDGEDAALDGELAGFSTAPPFMDEDEVLARLGALNAFPFLTPVIERLEDEAGTFMDGVDSRTDALNDAEFNLLTSQIARAYAVLLPRPHPLRGTGRLGEAFRRELSDLITRLPETPADATENLCAVLQGPQPALAAALIADTAEFHRKAPRKARPRKESIQPIFLLLRAAIAVLDDAIIR